MLQKKFMDAIIHNRVEEVRYYLLNTSINPVINKHDPLKKAAFYGYSDIISILSQDNRIQIDYQNHIILKIAFEQNHIDTCTKILDIYLLQLKNYNDIFYKNHLTLCLYLNKNDILTMLINKKNYSSNQLKEALIASQYYQDKWIIPLIINKVDINEKWINENIQDNSYQKVIKSYIKITNF